MVNCVLVSATTQHIEADINTNNTQLDNQSRFCWSILIFYGGIENSGRFEYNSPECLRPDFFKGRFESDNPHRLCIHPRRAMRTHHR
jgi:hypothetical protein